MRKILMITLLITVLGTGPAGWVGAVSTDGKTLELAPAVLVDRGFENAGPQVTPSVELVTRRDTGSQPLSVLVAPAISDLSVAVHGLAQADMLTTQLVSDPTSGDPFDGAFDPQVDGTAFWLLSVSPGAHSLVAEIVASESADVDLFVGTGNTPSAATQVCGSTGPVAEESCVVSAPAAGPWWVLAQNYSPENGPALPGQMVTLALAAVPSGGAGNLMVQGPASVPAGTPFDLRVFWDEPAMAAGDRWYGAFDLGTDPANPGNLGTTLLAVVRHEDDVVKTVSSTVAQRGDLLTYEITVRPNVTPDDLTYSIVDTIPAGFTYVAGSAAANIGIVSVVGQEVTWTGVMPAARHSYAVTTSDTDAACAPPLSTFDGESDAYLNVEAFGILANPSISGDTVSFDVDFAGGPFEFFGSPQGEVINFTDDGFAFFDPSTPGGTPWVHQPIPTAGDPDNLLAIFWRDMEIVYDGPTNRGVSLVNLTSGGLPVAGIIEYDNVEPWPAGSTTSSYDFELVAYYESDPAHYEYIFAYDNLTGPVGPGTIGLENLLGTEGVQVAFNDISVTSGMAICFDAILTGQTPAVITYDVTVDGSATPGVYTNQAVHVTDNPGDQEGTASVDVTVEKPLLVVLESFGAELVTQGVLLRWRTAMEVDNAGFRVWKETAGPGGGWEVLTPQLIPAQGSDLQGADYEFLDRSRRALGRVRYWLEDVDVWGTVTRHGPVTPLPR